VTKPRKKRRRIAKKSVPPTAAGAGAARTARGGFRYVAWLVGLVLLVAPLAWLLVIYPSRRGPGQGHSVEVTVDGAVSPSELARTLAAAGIVEQPRVFALWVRLTGGTAGVIGGLHLVTDDASPRELVARLERRAGGGSARVTFPEGWTRFDIARRLQDKHVVSLRAFLEATVDPALLRDLEIDGDSAEGFLFPATYDFPLDSDAGDIVRRMKREFDRRWDVLSRARSASLTDVMTSANLGVRDVVILASIVEKEAAVDDERPVIASVFLNRLRDPDFKSRRLESDPTAGYGCLAVPEKAASCALYTGKVTAAIVHDPDNPYSTYTHAGLPPGPIGNPGAKSLDAVMSPANTPFFFFVAKGEGRHAFSSTYEAHVSNIRR
jgi:UPF0755 protein